MPPSRLLLAFLIVPLLIVLGMLLLTCGEPAGAELGVMHRQEALPRLVQITDAGHAGTLLRDVHSLTP